MSNLEFLMAQDAIMHSRTKGSKNGDRRYQYEDGSLTPLGVEHQREMRRARAEAMGKGLSDAAKQVSEAGKNLPTTRGRYERKNYSKLSNQDLEKRIRRLELEDRYGQLTGDTKYVKSGSEKVQDAIKFIGATLGILASGAIIAKTVQDMQIDKKKQESK